MRIPVVAAALALVLVGCDSPTPEPPGPPSLSLAAVSQDSTPSQEAVAAVVPGFGGYFIDEAGAPTVWLTDPAERPTAEEALRAFLASRGYEAADLVVRQAAYDYGQLDAWYRAAWPAALAVSGAVYSDLDEAHNQLRFGGLDAGAVAGMTDAIAATGVPAAAVTVQVTGAIQQVGTLRDRIRPVQAGYQINFFPSPVSPLTLVCTLGFNAVASNGARSFITNSHCSNVQGGSETPTEYYQPLRGTPANPDNFIAIEVDDPNYDPLICPTPGFMCRYSDAARAEYLPGVEGAQGLIGRTLARDPLIGTLEVDPEQPFFTILQERGNQVVGEEANKVGRTTGWTFGRISETCINTIVLGTTAIMQLCQNRVDAGVDGGDSGSPVFGLVGNSGKVRLFGILWGGSVDETNPSFVYSPLEQVELELGPLETTIR